MRRLAIFAHFDPNDRVRPYVHHHLAGLKRSCERVVFVSTSALSASEQASLSPVCSDVFLRENVGLDFAMWKHALERVSLDEVDELVLTNSSVYGPLGDQLERAFASMAGVDCDVWGVTDSMDMDWHLQSYFLVFRRAAHASEAFRRFWAHVLPMKTKSQIIRSYELGLTSFFVESGFRLASLMPYGTFPPPPTLARLRGARRGNPTIFHPLELLERGSPYVKVELFRDNRFGFDLSALRAAMAARGFDLALIDGR
ncbi:MAG: hypothetical protein IPJ34_27670 [Myxococcales bacterium]|nr:hypothetical protein [Myxococcales bacterium]